MLSVKNDVQIVNINKDVEPCKQCGANLVDIINIKYMDKVENTATYIEEYCQCKQCKSAFILHYDLFDADGHLYSRVFTEDINNPENNWQDNLTEEQRNIIAQHLKSCKICIDRLDNETLLDTWLKAFIKELKK